MQFYFQHFSLLYRKGEKKKGWRDSADELANN